MIGELGGEHEHRGVVAEAAIGARLKAAFEHAALAIGDEHGVVGMAVVAPGRGGAEAAAIKAQADVGALDIRAKLLVAGDVGDRVHGNAAPGEQARAVVDCHEEGAVELGKVHLF